MKPTQAHYRNAHTQYNIYTQKEENKNTLDPIQPEIIAFEYQRILAVLVFNGV